MEEQWGALKWLVDLMVVHLVKAVQLLRLLMSMEAGEAGAFTEEVVGQETLVVVSNSLCRAFQYLF